MSNKVLYEKKGEVAYITLNRPEVKTRSTLSFIIGCERSGRISAMIRLYVWRFLLEQAMHSVPERIFARMYLSGPMPVQALRGTNFPTALQEGSRVAFTASTNRSSQPVMAGCLGAVSNWRWLATFV
jgi:hypothetical protein